MEKKRILIRTGNAVLAAMLSLGTVAGPLASWPVHAETLTVGSVTVDNTGGDNELWLDELGEAKYFTYQATVTFNDFEAGQQSAALAFGDMRANVHKKIDWNNPARLWGNSLTHEAVCPGDKGQANTWFEANGIDLSQPFTLKVQVASAGTVSYWINGILVCSSELKEGYNGGRIGLMTYSSSATFSNIVLEKEEEQPPAPDRTDLDALIAECQTLSEADYEAESWQALVDALQVAQKAVSQEEINAALTQLQAAKEALKEKPIQPSVDKTDLNKAIEEAGKLNEADYTTESWEVFTEALNKAKEVTNDDTANQEAVNNAAKALTEAQTALEKKPVQPSVDKTDLNKAIEEAGKLNEAEYTTESWKTFTEALNKAKEVANNDTASEETVAQALQALNDAKAALKSADDVKPEDFNNVGAGGSTVDQNALILDAAGDHFAMLSTQKTPSNDFHFEADVQLLAGTGEGEEGDQMSAALVFGAANKKQPGTKWYGANVDTRRKNEADYFRVFGAGRDILSGGRVDDVDATKPLHLAVDVKADGSLTYTFGNVGANMHTATGTIENWEGGYVGLLTFCAKAAFSNVRFTDRTVEQEKKPIETDNRWDNNLGESVAQGGSWSMSDDGLFSDATGKGDTFLISQMEGENFVYETDLSYRGDTGAAGLLFRFSNTENGKEGYAVNVDAGSHKAKFWRWEADQAQQLITEKEVEKADTYHLKVVCIDGSIQYWVNGVLIANLGDFTMQKDDLGQNTIVTKGYYGLLNWNSEAVFQNTKFTVLNENNTPVVLDVDVKSHTGTVDKKAQFFPESPTWMQYVKNDAQTVYLEAQIKEGANVTFEKDGTTYAAGQDIPIAEGANWITMTIEQGGVSRTYRLNVHRFAKESTYYNEPYRGQFHYSVKEGWANDPNGLVKYNGKYHMFYQFYDDTKWGPMHWMHATSTDLLHWEEEPVAFYPDMNGTMFSGCVAVDETNASKLFKTNKGGLIAYITVNGNGQRIKLAYSEDEGKTWKKSDKIAADWSDDSLYNKDFRDPKVFNWEGKWFMVVAGGPLRIYSSDDMVNWKEESAYNDLHTECPDLYPQQVDGTVKWILSRGGRFYKVGDLKEVDGKWTFVPDDYYKDKDGVMNFGRDSYAAMTYYESSFGTAANPTIPDIIELNWMNTWDDYCDQVADTVGQKYNGTFNLHLKIGLVRDANGVYRLTQTPIDAYEQLRGTGVEKSDKVGADNDLLKDFQGTSYEIVSRFIPESGTKKVGFKVRTGANGEETAVIYDVENNTLTLDRSKSGIQISNKFAETNSQDLSDLIQRSKTTRNADGSIDLHLFVDASSVEVFANGYTAAGANQIFPLPTSRGASVVVEGDPCQVDLTVYPLDSIWEKENVGTIIDSSDAREQTIYTGKTKQLSAYILPVDTDQSVEWSSDNPDVASVDENGIVSGHKAGTATITVQAKSDPALKLEFAITVKEDNFNTNVNDTVTDGNWVIENDELINDNKGQNAFWLSKETFDKDYTVSTDVKFGSGLVNIFFASNGSPFDKEAYAVQLTQDNALRLFRFGGGDDATVELDKPLCDDTYHNVEITKKGKSVTVSVDGKEVLKHTYDAVDSHFDTAHVGLGLWDGKASFKNFMVTTAEQPVVVDKTDLNAAIEAAGKLNEADYTPESWKVFATALNKANEVAKDDKASQDAVDEATKTLNDAQKALKKPEQPVVDADALKKACEEAKNIDREAYTAESVAALDEAYGNAIEVLENENMTQEQVDKALNALNAAIKGLTLKPEQPVVVDKTTLNKAIEAAGKLNEADYTPESWKVFATALNKANEVAKDDKASQDAVDEATKTLNDAQKALKKPEQPVVDADALKKACEEAKNIDREAYTAESVAALDEAYGNAIEVLENENMTQEQVDKALNALNAAIKGLTLKPEQPVVVDKTTLNEAIEEASKVDPAPYTQESWDVFAAALKTAQTVAANEQADQKTVDKALADLETAKAGLKEIETPVVVDKTDLNAAIEAAGKLNEADYTPESWKVFAAALNKANEVAKDDKASQDAVDEATKALNDAQKALKKAEQPVVVDKTKLEEAIQKAEGLKEKDYTAKSWEAFVKALNDAKAIQSKQDASQQDVDEACKALENAIKQLVKPATGGSTGTSGSNSSGTTSTRRPSASTAAATGMTQMFATAGASLLGILAILKKKYRK